MPSNETTFATEFPNGILDTVCICENPGLPLHMNPYIEHERIYCNIKFL